MKQNRSTLAVAAIVAILVASAAPAVAVADDPKPGDIAHRMAVVAADLAKKQTGEPVQVEQKVIVRDLDDLIAALERECQGCKNGVKRNNPRGGMPDSMIRAGTGGVGDLVNPADGGKDWGKLSERERDRILQSMSEGFPPEYRTVLERYYRRLAEEKSAKTPGDAARAKEPAAPVPTPAPSNKP